MIIWVTHDPSYGSRETLSNGSRMTHDPLQELHQLSSSTTGLAGEVETQGRYQAALKRRVSLFEDYQLSQRPRRELSNLGGTQ